MANDNSSARDDADKHFTRLRDDKTANVSKRMNTDRVKADTDKSARLKAARLAKAEEDVREKGGDQTGENLCRRCGGSGRIDESACPDCGGTGLVVEIVGDA